MSKRKIIKIDWWLWRVIASTWVITEYAKKNDVSIITTRPLVFRGNPYIKSIHWIDDRRLYEDVIKWNDYIEIEPYTMPEYFNNREHIIKCINKQLTWNNKFIKPIIFTTEEEKILNKEMFLDNTVLFQPFGSGVENILWVDKTYRSMTIDFAEMVVNWLLEKWYSVVQVGNDFHPNISWAKLYSKDLRSLISSLPNYKVIWIDSFLYHANKAMWWQSVVIWAGWPTEEMVWYSDDINIREKEIIDYVPYRLPVNDFDFNNINRDTNKFTEITLWKILSYF